MSIPNIIIGGKTTMAIDGAVAVRAAADARGWNGSIGIVPNLGDVGEDSWQPSFRKFGSATPGFQLFELDDVYALENLVFFSLEFDRIFRVDRSSSNNLFNIHFSLLPAYKGVSTSTWPIIEGRSESGVTLHQIDQGIDTGPIICQVKFTIGAGDTGADLYRKYISHGTELFVSMVDRLLDGDFEASPQPAAGSTYRSRSDLDYSTPIQNWRSTAFELHNRIRAFTFPEYQNVSFDGLMITSSRIDSALSSGKAGSVVAVGHGRRTIATIDYDLILLGIESGPNELVVSPAKLSGDQ
jgi:methionyl-tRNA formyltransferase